MSSSDDDWGCLALAAVLAFGGWWAYNHYEVKKRVPEALLAPKPTTMPRAIGWVELSRDDKGGIWSANADSVTGPRNARAVWTMIDSRSDKKRTTSWAMTRELYQINCDTGGMRSLSLVAYNAKEKVVFHEDRPDAKSEYYPPQSFGAGWSKFACAKTFDEPAEPSAAIAPT